MTQYKTQYGTIFAVKEHNGAPAIMCRAELSETWSLSSMIEPFTPGAWTAEELQAQLDSWAATKGWQPVEAPASAEPPLPMPGDVYQAPQSGQLYKIGELTNGKKTCYLTMRSNAQGGTWVPANSSVYPNLSDAQGEFEAWIRTEQLEPVAPNGDAAATTAAPAFDYSGLDVVTVDTLHLAENIIRSARQKYIVDLAGAVDMAHEELVRNSDGHNQHTEETFVAWCRSVGISKTTAYQLLQVQALITGSTPEEQAVLEAASPSLLYAAAKPSAPAELVQAVKDGDITSHKQYQEALAEIRARDAKITDLLDMSEAADRRADKAEQAAKDTARERDAALRRAAEAEKQRDGARDENTSLKAQIRELEARPVEVAVAQPGEEQIEAWRKEGEARATAALRDSIRKADQAKADAQRQVDALQDQLAAARPDADACQRTVDTLYETTENLRLLLRTQLRQAQLPPATYSTVVAHVLQAADALRDTVRSCAPASYTMDDEEDDFL